MAVVAGMRCTDISQQCRAGVAYKGACAAEPSTEADVKTGQAAAPAASPSDPKRPYEL